MIPFDKFLEMTLKMKCLMTAYYMVWTMFRNKIHSLDAGM